MPGTPYATGIRRKSPEERELAVKCAGLHMAYLKCMKGNHLFSGRSCTEEMHAYVDCTKTGPQTQTDTMGAIGESFSRLVDAASEALGGGKGDKP